MAFEDSFNDNIRLDFGTAVQSVIDSDMSEFGETKRGRFLNRILLNYYQQADASVVERREEYGAQIYRILTEQGEDDNKDPDLFHARDILRDKNNRSIVDAVGIVLKNQKQKDLISEMNRIRDNSERFGHEQSRSAVHIHSELYRYLTDKESCREGEVYNRLADYLKAVIREYCQLPYLQREEIYFKDRYELIRRAIQEETALKITTSKGDEWLARPYKIVAGPYRTAEYIASYSCRSDADPTASIPSSFRISAIRAIHPYPGISGHISSQDKAELDRMIEKRGIQYLLSDTEDIRVRLTSAGKDIYLHSATQRPSPVSPSRITDEDDIYTFRCSRRQASNYFFKFGGDAEILEPVELRREFARKYRRGLALYGDS